MTNLIDYLMVDVAVSMRNGSFLGNGRHGRGNDGAAHPASLATVAAVQRNTTHITIAADRDVSVDYRVTGIRDGYEDKQVVRPQAEQ